jgi:hypothetical protein
LKQRLLQCGEKALVDKGYRGEPNYIDLPDDGTPLHQYMKDRVHAHHETCNKRFKQFGRLGQRFRHEISPHKACFNAVVVLTQMAIQNDEPIWDSMVL